MKDGLTDSLIRCVRRTSICVLAVLIIVTVVQHSKFWIKRMDYKTVRSTGPRIIDPCNTTTSIEPISNDRLSLMLQRKDNHSQHCLLWPDFFNETDRVIEQILYKPENINDIKQPKWVFLPFDTWHGFEPPFNEHTCRVHQCIAYNEHSTPNQTYTNLSDADAVIIGSNSRVGQNYMMARYSGNLTKQIWVWHALESPMHTPLVSQYNGLINWTATYRLDSDITAGYGKWVRFDGGQYHDVQTEVFQQTLSPMIFVSTTVTPTSSPKTNDTFVVWVASNCRANNHRQQFVEYIQRYLNVDVYGNCGDHKCTINRSSGGTGLWRCDRSLDTRYKFLLSFENSNCRDYITEKFYENALWTNLVPVVLGASISDYERVAPPNSFIHIDQFDGDAFKLSAYLLYLNSNQTAYNEYLAWKTLGYRPIRHRFWCRLCAMLHAADMRPVKWYNDLNGWWRGNGVCRHSTFHAGGQSSTTTHTQTTTNGNISASEGVQRKKRRSPTA